MIQFKITTAPDRSQVANYDHYNTEMTIGSSDADMVIDDPAIAATQLKIFFQGEQAVIQNITPEIPIKVNATTITDESILPLKKRDTVRFGSTALFITALSCEKIQAPPADNSYAEKLSDSGNAASAIYEALKHLTENQKEKTKPPIPPNIQPTEASTKPPLPNQIKPPLPPVDKE